MVLWLFLGPECLNWLILCTWQPDNSYPVTINSKSNFQVRSKKKKSNATTFLEPASLELSIVYVNFHLHLTYRLLPATKDNIAERDNSLLYVDNIFGHTENEIEYCITCRREGIYQ